MTNELNYTKEATYKFNYNGDTLTEDHYVDNKINQRYRFYNNQLDNEFSMPLNVKGTGASYEEFTAILIGERILFEDESGRKKAELLYLLPDISCYINIQYQKEYEFGSWNTLWSFPSSILIFKP